MEYEFDLTNVDEHYLYRQIKSALFGIAVGDALGVPVEFNSRDTLKLNPVTDMHGYGTYNQPKGTWSDDSSLTFCLAEALCEPYDLTNIAQKSFNWFNEGYWSARGEVFDIGRATLQAMRKFSQGIRADECGGESEYDNGNGSLMRILPLIFYSQQESEVDRYELAMDVSCITHRHSRSIIACYYYLEFARHLLEGYSDKFAIYDRLQFDIKELLLLAYKDEDLRPFERLFNQNIWEISESEIQSTGYVVHTLEASIWCLLTTDSYQEAVLKAVNLGDDSDTTAAVTGGLAGILYGFENIPENWVNELARRDDIDNLAKRFTLQMIKHNNV
ncbi:hypothetical protein A1D22_06835 [Pasteurellaceae bacterium LFhippo2]|nr:hypothetical protein [Pasteurellaceae bacterium LFhippo2]